jgi:hypothetical protein
MQAHEQGQSHRAPERFGTPRASPTTAMHPRLWDSQPTLPGVRRKPTPVPRKDRCVLTVLSGQDSGKVFHSNGAELIIGRSSSAHAPLGDPRVSRRHARLVQRQEGIYLEDLGSTNGTFLYAWPRAVERALLPRVC